jgi:hypothetical protein
MHQQIEMIRKTRIFLLEWVNDLSVEQLNATPAGFNNNIIWNMAHLIAAQQGICYKPAGLNVVVEEVFFESYKPGTMPVGEIDAAGVQLIKALLLSSLDQLETDTGQDLFSGYNPWATRYGVAINNLDDALQFIKFHEGLHTGYIMALKKLIVK